MIADNFYEVNKTGFLRKGGEEMGPLDWMVMQSFPVGDI